MRRRQRGDEAFLSKRERSDLTSVNNSSARRGPFDLQTQRTRSWGPPLYANGTVAARHCVFVLLFDAAQKQFPCKYSPTSTVNNVTKNSPFRLHYGLI